METAADDRGADDPPPTAAGAAYSLPAPLQRNHAALLFFDVVESVRLMQHDEDEFVRLWLAFLRRVRSQVLPPLRGRMIKSYGDGALLAFDRVIDAVRAAFQIHDLVQRRQGRPDNGPAIALRVGIHSAAVVVDEWDIFGNGVNLAARIAALAAPGETLASTEAREAVVDGLELRATDTGEHWLKHIECPVRAYRLEPLDASAATPRILPAKQFDVRPGIAVLPFSKAWGSDDHPALGQALADDLTAAFSRAAGWRVISSLSTSQCRGEAAVPALARLLGVHYLLGGRYRANGSVLVLNVELTDGCHGDLTWAESFRLRIDDLFGGQDAALHEVVRVVGRTILHAQLKRTQALPFSRLEDYSIRLSALALMHRLNPHDQQRAQTMIDYLEERHRRSAEPAAMRTRWHALRMAQGLAQDPAGEGRRALASAREALDRDPQHPFALPMSAVLAAQMGEPLLPAIAQAQSAIEAHPQEPMAGLALGLLQGYVGDSAGFERHSSEATRLTPLDPALYVYLCLLASAKISVGKFEEAATAARQAICTNATYVPAHVALSVALQMSGQREAALAAARDVMILQPTFSVRKWMSMFNGRGPPDMPARGHALRALGLPE